MRKAFAVLILLAIIISISTASVIYNNQAHVIISKNFGVSVGKEAEIVYIEKEKAIEGSYISYDIVVRVKDSEYQDVLNNIKNAGYESYGEGEEDTFGWEAKNWIPFYDVKPQVERYQKHSVKKNFLF